MVSAGGLLGRWTAQPVAVERTNPMQVTVEPGGPLPVVLLHGQPGTGSDWQRVVPLLQPEFTVVVPDRPGYGATGGPATGFVGNAASLAGLLDRLGMPRAVVVGHSWAGGVAQAFAVHHRERVSGLVLVSSVAPGERVTWDDRVLAAPVAGELIAAGALGGMGLVLANRRLQDLASRHLPPRARDAMVALTRLTGSRSAVWRSFVAEQRALLDELDGLAAGLGTVEAPTAIVYGDADHIVGPSTGAALQRAIPGARSHVLAGAGHRLPHDRPEAVAAAVREVSK